MVAPLLEFVVLVVVFAVAFIALTEVLHAMVGERADACWATQPWPRRCRQPSSP